MKITAIIILLIMGHSSYCQTQFRRNKTPISNTNTVNIFLRLGDSNEAGGTAKQDGTFPSKYNSVYNNALIYYKPNRSSSDNGLWLNYSDSNPTINRASGYQPVISTSPPYSVGADISFSYSVDSGYRNKVGIIKTALGGTKATDWSHTTDSLYLFFRYSIYGLGKLSSLNYNGYKIKALIVRLGTNDCAAYNNATFKAAIQSLVTNVRADMNSPLLPIYWVQVNTNLRSTYSGASVDSARASILACTNIASPAYIQNFNVLNYDADSLLPDGIHYDQNACIRQGIYEANLMFGIN